MRLSRSLVLFACAVAWLPCGEARPAELVALSPQTWDRFAPRGKEVDCIYGDFALANDRLMAVVAHPRRGRNANMTVREVGGCLIDLTVRDGQSDQLSAYYPGAQLRDLRFAGVDVEAPEVYETAELDRVFVRARRVTLRLVAEPKEGQPDVEVAYALEEGWPYVLVTTTFRNSSGLPQTFELLDSLRADRSFEKSPEGRTDLFWVYDKAFGQAYGLVAEGHALKSVGDARRLQVRYANSEGKVGITLEPGKSYRLVRRIIPGANLFDLERVAGGLAGRTPRVAGLTVKDTEGRPVPQADVVLERGGKPLAWGRTNDDGKITIGVPEGSTKLTVTSLGRGSKSVGVGANAGDSLDVELPAAGEVVAAITDEKGGPIPCKVQFIGRDGAESPNFGPDSGEFAVGNLRYTPDGTFRQALEPGTYDLIVSYGPEYDAVFSKVTVAQGKETPLEAKLVRTVRTDGWISADFHSHASPSGDNTASQLGRVLNLLCEHVEFAPCTEHNRVDSYTPHLRRLGVEPLMATCSGMELTGRPLPLNHQNAFPLVMRPRTQDGGGPTTDDDPAIQIERLAYWDGNGEKLVQVNHPDLGWMFFDRNGDGQRDGGFSGMVRHMDVIEVHPLHTIFSPPTGESQGKTQNNTIGNWLQLLNQGHRIPGVVNTDAHYNVHGSGWLRNYIASPTDDPARVQTPDMVRASERGRLVMSSGPFLEVKLRNGSGEAGPGEDLVASGGEATLHVRVQCPNWFDVDRVQVFINGRAVDDLNFTREKDSDKFSDKVVKFDRDIPLKLDRDAHVVVATIGEHSKLGPVMGAEHGDDKPVAVSNPIFVDVDGGGFKASGDTLGSELPVKGGLAK
jgi:hypothetical protein